MQGKGQKPSEKTSGSQLFQKVAENLYRHQSSLNYFAWVKRGGKQFRRSLKTNDRKLAERRLIEFRDKVTRLNRKNLDRKITFWEIASMWHESIKTHQKKSSALRRETSLNKLRPYFGNLPIARINDRACQEWILRRSGQIAASTFNKERETLILVIDHAIREGLMLDNPAKLIKRRKPKKSVIKIPTQGEFCLLVAALRSANERSTPAADLVELLAYSGMRLGEAIELRLGDINFQRNIFLVTGGEIGTKNHEVRAVPLFPAMLQLIERILDRQTLGTEDLITQIRSAKKALITACKKAGIPNYTHHSFRHYFVSNAVEAGINFATIAGWVGHKDGGLLVANTYGHLRDDHSMEMAKKMVFTAEKSE